jgi:predicted nucleic acid-binding protein
VELAILDTDALIDFTKGEGMARLVEARIRAKAAATTAVAVFEVARGLDPDEAPALRRVLRGVRVYPLDALAARRAAELWRALEAAGHRIGERDIMAAAIALAAGLPMLTRNVKHFGRVPGLRLTLR